MREEQRRPVRPGRTGRGKIIIAWATLALMVPGLSNALALKHRPSREARAHPEAVLIAAVNAREKRRAGGSGALIAPDAVLTAAHVADGFDHLEVLAPYARGGPQRRKVQEVRLHPGHRRGLFENDLAVLLLEGDIDLGRALPTLHDGDLYPINTPLVVVGRVDNGTVSDGKLFEAGVTLVAFPGNQNVYGGHPQTVEHGDSGGPVYVRDREGTIAGVVSGYLGFTRGHVPTDLLVPVSRQNRAWILQQLRPRRE
ncbi:MAG: S1 family peptidase [Gemmataceae bacterium]|nr:S1 family peptidase [Gemmataceae bacterium]MDW8266900.1 S1 family peptidase [Gemmataceae bacterium]